MSIGRSAVTSRGQTRSLLALGLCFALVLAGSPGLFASPPESPELDTRVFTRWAGDVYRLGVANSPSAEGNGTVSISFEKAPLNTGSSHGFELPIDTTLAFHRTAEEALDEEGPSGTRVGHWESVLSLTLSSDIDGVTTSYRVGPDVLTLSLPGRPAGTGEAPQRVFVDVNGFAVEVDTASLEQLQKALSKGDDIAVPEELEALAEQFVDREGFMRANLMFQTMFRQAIVRPARGGNGRCLLPCSLCVASVIGYGGSYIGLVLACGFAFSTGGTAGLACVMAYLLFVGAQITVLASCVGCFQCLEQPPPCNCTGQPMCPCDETGG